MFAFTLAEVLITLVIIGVIAAITVPTLITKYQKEQTVTRLKKVYSTLSQTTARAIADNGPIETWEIGLPNNSNDAISFINKYIAPYINIIKAPKDISEGWDSIFYLLNGNEASYGEGDVRFYISDGTSVTSYIYKNSNSTVIRLDMYIDINGDKKPNKVGRDIFFFIYDLKQGIFSPINPSSSRNDILSNCNKQKSGTYCATLIMKDSWQIKDDYPW
ncbi:prepilin-type N-terminal cleavage/methylation domain-containing protein [bacterium]|nr:prepilin-type N-terminal cleavage/methylation domain-containing protein [bacterium]